MTLVAGLSGLHRALRILSGSGTQTGRPRASAAVGRDHHVGVAPVRSLAPATPPPADGDILAWLLIDMSRAGERHRGRGLLGRRSARAIDFDLGRSVATWRRGSTATRSDRAARDDRPDRRTWVGRLGGLPVRLGRQDTPAQRRRHLAQARAHAAGGSAVGRRGERAQGGSAQRRWYDARASRRLDRYRRRSVGVPRQAPADLVHQSVTDVRNSSAQSNSSSISCSASSTSAARARAS